MQQVAEAHVRIRGDTSSVESDVRSGFGGALSTFAKRGAIAAGVGVGGGISKGIRESISFDQDMREVFTLLPGISGEAMDGMKDQLLDLGTEFGAFTEDTVPALYDSLSAGVPQDNVFEFLETANKFAVAGATDVGTAVDGLTTLVNAFGLEASEAGNLSDQMFAAVKAGKTTVDELSASMFQVAPLAATLNVGTDELAATFATLTAQGTPTSVAATQMKGALTALTRPTEDLNKIFTEFTGSTAESFLASGGSMTDAFKVLQEATGGNVGELTKLLGSTEAVAAVLGTTGGASEMQAANLEAMANSAGAVDEAFAVMDAGIGSSLNKIKAATTQGFIQLGDALAPTVARITERIVGFIEDGGIDRIRAGIEQFIGFVRPAFELIADNAPIIAAALGGILTAVGGSKLLRFTNLLTRVGPVVAALTSPVVLAAAGLAALAAGAVWAYQNVEQFRTVVDAVWLWIQTTAIPIIQDLTSRFVEWLIPAVQSLATQIVEFLLPHLRTFGQFLTETVIPIVQDLADRFVEWLIPALQNLSTFVLEEVIPAVQAFYERVAEILMPVIAALAQFVTGSLVPALSTVAAFIVSDVVPVLMTLWGVFQNNVIPVVVGLVTVFIQDVLPAIGSVAEFITGILIPAVLAFAGFLLDNVLPAILDLIGLGFDVLKPVVEAAGTLFETFGSIATGAIGWVSDVVQGLIDKVESLIGWIAQIDLSNIPGAGILGDVGGFLNPFANGGMVTGATRALIGEAGPELVLPLTRPGRIADLMAQFGGPVLAAMGAAGQSGNGVAGSGDGSKTVNYHVQANDAWAVVNEIARWDEDLASSGR